MIRIVIIGAGLIGPRHAQSVQVHPLTQLTAFIDPSPTAIPIAQSFNVPHFPSITSMLDALPRHQHPHAAIVCTPNHTHVAVAKELISHGIHILLEKPVSDSIESAQDLLSTINERPDVKILVGHHRRFNPYVQTTKTQITTNSLGTLIAVNGLWTLQKSDDYFAPPLGAWRADKSKGGVFGINLIHDIDLLHFFFGPITRVHAESIRPQRHRANTSHTAEEGAALTLRFASGVVGTFLVCDATPSPLNFETGTGENPLIPRVDPTKSASDCYRIFGSEGSLSVPDMTRWSYGGQALKGWNGDLTIEKVSVEGVDVKPFDKQLGHFVDVLQGRVREVSCSVEDGVRALMVVRAAKESLEKGMPVEI
ncbi:quinate utilization oxidoreductase QutH [Talaromyces proteolyticus]|uniref:Quinate utilization oxidoreductase QutH n=1 Tax=Talaromyces proteolyticus TaxID=1131652 RepID=A0AAD4Q500_9EURO|nr:quinate utilization oxidoreductase QutH [Talaromyces proteolyticus]KAH8703791.1 quinate utilization oxidoreductase QutH [Talaromyces proteolyticus]